MIRAEVKSCVEPAYLYQQLPGITKLHPTQQINRMYVRPFSFLLARRAQFPPSTSRNHQSTLRRTYALGKPSNPAAQPFKIWPFAAIFVAGTISYVLMVKSRASEAPPKPRSKNITSSSTPS